MSHAPLPKKSLGQHWLDDDVSLQAMLFAADVQPDDTVLEIGPGPGALTRLLVKAAHDVVAVEFDHDLAVALPGRVSAKNLRVVQNDILSFDLTAMPVDYKVVANIPYYLTSKLVRVLSESTNRPTVTALLVQKEVAERLAAAPGDLSILGVTAQFYWEITLGAVVPAEYFTPPPKVDSQIVIMKRRAGLPFSTAMDADEPTDTEVNNADEFDVRQFFRVVKAGFGARRKTLLNSLGGGLHLDKKQTAALLLLAGIDPKLRAQNLSLDDWQAVYTAYRASNPDTASES